VSPVSFFFKNEYRLTVKTEKSTAQWIELSNGQNFTNPLCICSEGREAPTRKRTGIIKEKTLKNTSFFASYKTLVEISETGSEVFT